LPPGGLPVVELPPVDAIDEAALLPLPGFMMPTPVSTPPLELPPVLGVLEPLVEVVTLVPVPFPAALDEGAPLFDDDALFMFGWGKLLSDEQAERAAAVGTTMDERSNETLGNVVNRML
jgi:hypothetical protein